MQTLEITYLDFVDRIYLEVCLSYSGNFETSPPELGMLLTQKTGYHFVHIHSFKYSSSW